MGNQCLDASQAFSKRAQSYSLQELSRSIEVSKLKSDHAAETRHLLLREFMAGMVRKARVVNLGYILPFGQVFRHRHAVYVMGFHPHRQRFDPPQNEPRIKRRQNAARRVLDELK